MEGCNGGNRFMRIANGGCKTCNGGDTHCPEGALLWEAVCDTRVASWDAQGTNGTLEAERHATWAWRRHIEGGLVG